MSCTASYTITQADLDAGSATNHATASGGGATSNQATETVTAVQTLSLLLTKAAIPLEYDHVGQMITYTYGIQNSGNVTLTGAFSVTDDKTGVFCTQPGDGALSPGETMSCTATYAITQGDLDAGSLTNLATATGAGVTSNQATQTVSAVQTLSLHLTKAADPTVYDLAGQAITYSYVIQNTGNVTLTGIFSVTDDKADVTCTPPVDGSLSPGETMNCTATYTVNQNDMDAGSVTNHATASGAGLNSNQATATITANQNSTLSLTKDATPLIYDHVGQVIVYTYTLENSGNVTLTGPFTVIDDKVTNETCPSIPTSLGPGQLITCGASYTILTNDMVSGVVTNNAYATCIFGANTVTSNTATKTVRANRTLTYTYIPLANKPYPPGVFVLPDSYFYQSHNTMFVIGEVLNNTNDVINWIDVAVDFFDNSGHIVGTNFTYMWPLDLPARVKGCFNISMNVPQNWSYYQFEPLTYSISNTSPGLVIFGDSGVFTPGNFNYDIYGQAQNNGNLPSLSVNVGGTLYNNAGTPIGCERATLNSVDLPPGGSSAFHINYSGYYRNYADVAYYKLRVAGELP